METVLIRNEAEYVVATVVDFGKRFQLTSRQAFRYLQRYGAIDFLLKHY